MIKEFSFRFDDLSVKTREIASVLGYDNCPLPSPFDDYLESALADARNLNDICATYRIVENINLEDKTKKVIAEGVQFNVGKTIYEELKCSEKLAFFICTSGKTISNKSSGLLKGDDPVKGYIYDVLGSAIAEAVGDKVQSFLKQQIGSNGLKISNRYSPGYCNWPVSDQHRLFSLFHPSPCGVSLTSSALMSPVKSISGIIGIGKNIKYRDYQCEICLSKNCSYRKLGRNLDKML